MTNKQKLNKLCNIRTDLGDDSSHVSTINSAIQSVADDFEDLFSYSYGSTNSGSVKNKIEGLKEPSQSNDRNIKNAKSYCQHEINNVCAAIEKEEK